VHHGKKDHIMRMSLRTIAVLTAVILAAGIVAHPVVPSQGAVPSPQGQTHTYYVAADEVAWDYAPSGRDQITGRPFDDVANVFVQRGPERIGHVYRKARYREYTDVTFTHLKPVPPQWRHLGLLGPVLRASVGDTIRVVFKNNTHRPYSIHPHGVFYKKNAEGSPYNDGTTGSNKSDDAVPPGQMYTYVWPVPERAGPGPMDGSSVLWMYHSHVDEVRDTNAGLIGPIIITRRGMARPDGTPKDVDREVVTLFKIVDENTSWYLDQNIRTYTGQPGLVKKDDEEFEESNLMHTINGYVYGNMPRPTMHKGERVRWYVMDLGTETDLHTPHWHGNTVLMTGMRTDMLELLPGTMRVADMVPDDVGTWLFHCHVNDHITAGMQALYTVTP
jgi:FtsP/CotA-like multicopper oxidase with cupredoxin domain